MEKIVCTLLLSTMLLVEQSVNYYKEGIHKSFLFKFGKYCLCSPDTELHKDHDRKTPIQYLNDKTHLSAIRVLDKVHDVKSKVRLVMLQMISACMMYWCFFHISLY